MDFIIKNLLISIIPNEVHYKEKKSVHGALTNGMQRMQDAWCADEPLNNTFSITSTSEHFVYRFYNIRLSPSF